MSQHWEFGFDGVTNVPPYGFAPHGTCGYFVAAVGIRTLLPNSLLRGVRKCCKDSVGVSLAETAKEKLRTNSIHAGIYWASTFCREADRAHPSPRFDSGTLNVRVFHPNSFG